MRLWKTLALSSVGFLAVSCGQVDAVVDQAGQVAGKAGICAEALGIGDIKLGEVNPEALKNQATEKADRLRELAAQTAEPDLNQTLTQMADSYVALEKKKAEQLGNLNDWFKTNTDNIDKLRKACF